MGNQPQDERNASRFAGKINVPGSPIMLKQHRKPNVLVRTTSVVPDDDYADGFPAAGDAVINDREQRQARRKTQ